MNMSLLSVAVFKFLFCIQTALTETTFAEFGFTHVTFFSEFLSLLHL